MTIFSGNQCHRDWADDAGEENISDHSITELSSLSIGQNLANSVWILERIKK